MKFSVVIPAYNEENGIGEVLDELLSLNLGEDVEFIVINDGSKDNTSDVLREYADKVKIIEHEFNMGYGASLKTGIKAAERDIVVITDADRTYPNEQIENLVKDMDKYDMVVGARTGENVHQSYLRKLPKWFLHKLANFLTGRKIPDLNSGLRAMKKEIVESFYHILPDGFSFTTTITLAMLTTGLRVKYMPIDYHKREGKSKIHPIKDTLLFIRLVITTVLYFNPLKVFLPFSLSFIAISLGLLIYRLVMGQGFEVTSVLFFTLGIQLLAIGMIADLIDKKFKSR